MDPTNRIPHIKTQKEDPPNLFMEAPETVHVQRT